MILVGATSAVPAQDAKEMYAEIDEAGKAK
jgi:hypothetical protein